MIPKRIKSGFDFSMNDYVELELKIEVEDFVPGYPAPPCSNHDSPAFSDTGADSEYGDVKMFFVLEKKKWDPEKHERVVVEKVMIPVPEPMINILINDYDIDENIFEEGERQSTSDYDEYCEREFDRRRDEGI